MLSYLVWQKQDLKKKKWHAIWKSKIAKCLKDIPIIYMVTWPIYVYITDILHINDFYTCILHISGGKLGQFTWWWNTSWSVLEHWIFGLSFAVSNTVTHRLTSWRECICFLFKYLYGVSLNTAQLTVCGPQGVVLWVTSNLTIWIHLKLESTPFIDIVQQ